MRSLPMLWLRCRVVPETSTSQRIKDVEKSELLYSASVAEGWQNSPKPTHTHKYTYTFKELILSSNDSNEWTMKWSISTRVDWSTQSIATVAVKHKQSVRWIGQRLGSQPYILLTVRWKVDTLQAAGAHPLCYAAVAVSGQKWMKAGNRHQREGNFMKASGSSGRKKLRKNPSDGWPKIPKEGERKRKNNKIKSNEIKMVVCAFFLLLSHGAAEYWWRRWNWS